MNWSRFTTYVALLLLVLVVAGILSGCPQQPGIRTVSIEMLAYNPKNLTIPAGTRVVWTNDDDSTHTVTADLGGFNSPVLNPGDTYELIFKNKGVFKYHCDVHPYMKAQVAVE